MPGTDPRPAAQPPGTQAVDRAARLLVDVIEADAPRPFTRLLTDSGLPKSTTSRLLSALERHGLVQRDHGGAFRPGPVLARYAGRAGTADLAAAARGTLERIGERTGETVNLAVLSGGAVELVDQVDSPHLLGATNWVGVRVPLHCSALGKVFLAYGAASLPRGPLERRTRATVTDREALRGQLAQVRRAGYAVTMEELEPGLVAVAAAVRGRDGTVVAALSVSGPAVRLDAERVTEVGELLAAEAGALSDFMGAS